jgi:N-acetylmuramic acid 6-phosphate etherase
MFGKGRKDMLNGPRPATEDVHPQADELEGAPAAELLAAMSANDRVVPAIVASQIEPMTRLVDETAGRLRSGGRIHYFGAGTSGRLAGLDAAEIPPTFGVPRDLVVAHLAGGAGALAEAIEGAEDSFEQGVADARAAVRSGDVAVGVAASGETPYVRGAMSAARETGAFAAVVVCTTGSTLASEVEVAIELPVGPEIVAGSTRLKAGSAQKMALNMFSTAVFWRLGHVYRGRMVDVVPSNAKLRRRIEEMVAELSSRDLEDAARAVREAGGAKLAILMLRTGLDREAAAARLEAAHGDLGLALRETSEGSRE